MIEELTVYEVAKILSIDKKPVDFYVSNDEPRNWVTNKIHGIKIMDEFKFITVDGNGYKYCGVFMADKYEQYPERDCPHLSCGDTIKHNNGVQYLVTAIDINEDEVYHVKIDKEWLSNEDLFYNYTYINKTPIGIPIRN